MSTEQIVGALVVAAVCWMAKVLLSVAKELTEWRIILFGQDGTNGMRSDVRALREDVDELMGKRFVRRASDIA